MEAFGLATPRYTAVSVGRTGSVAPPRSFRLPAVIFHSAPSGARKTPAYSPKSRFFGSFRTVAPAARALSITARTSPACGTTAPSTAPPNPLPVVPSVTGVTPPVSNRAA
ncbi:hypothetical protein TSST111916_01050 [Tsukamurella strandjordii]